MTTRKAKATAKQIPFGNGKGWDVARQLSVVAIMVVGLGLLAWAGVYNFRAREARMEQAREAHITLTKDGSGGTADLGGAMPDALGKDFRGKAAPGFALASIEGKKVSSASFKGKPMVINFWATYCGPCKLEMPWFEEFSKKYAAQGLQVVGIDDEEGVTKQEVAAAAKKVGVTYPILIADKNAESAFGLGDYLPVTFYIDANGVVQAQTPGAPSKAQVEANIRKILPAGGM
jgi:thiol-disulfide isomerase/thioredoxin